MGIWNAFVGLLSSIWVLLAALLLPLLGGCTVGLKGSGQVSFGMNNMNEVFFKHTVDGDKQDKSSESQTSIDQTILDAFLPSASDDVTEPEPDGDGT